MDNDPVSGGPNVAFGYYPEIKKKQRQHRQDIK
jgi:hypothetical protein